MDSPVILDSATKFGRGFDLDRDFPFDEEGFCRRGDIRAHLDDLAARHPEFADHLLGPPWADVPFAGGGGGIHRGSRNRRGSNERSHNNPDEDARSQASGSSAASGASAASSHGEPDEQQQQQQQPGQRLPQYGLRNTVDIGQQQHNMENPQQQRRDIRSMSAPPENRNGVDPNQQRFVSRVDITPQAQQTQNTAQQQPQPQQQPQAQREKSPAPQQQKSQSQQQQGNVRHIPIFVEGRDEPVIPKGVDEPDFPRRQQSPPQFQRPSQFQQHYKKQPAGWSSAFQDPFFDHSTRRFGYPPEHPQFRHAQQQERPRSQQSHYTESQPQNQRQKPQAQSQAQPQQKPPPQQEAQPEAPPKPRQQTQPKDPLERVALVQNEVNSLTEQVKAYTGNSRQDKQYMYLDEMLTRELIKLDDIETEGKENVRQARKQAIKSIQDSISLLESKAPLPGQQQQQEEAMTAEPVPTEEDKKDQPMNGVENGEVKSAEPTATEDTSAPAEAMETSEVPVPAEPAAAVAATATPAAPTEEPQQKAIPLPPPSSPTKLEVSAAPIQEPEVSTAPAEAMVANAVPEQPEQAPAVEPMEVRQSTPVKDEAPEAQPQEAIPLPEPPREQDKPKKEPPAVPAKPGKSPKKAKKAKQAKQPEPVSETAIPLPAPGQSI